MAIEYAADGTPIAVVTLECDACGEIMREIIDEEATAVLLGEQTPESKRRRAYEAEADPIRDQALSYQLEADAWREEGDEDSAAIAEEKAAVAREKYLAKKIEIRDRHPDPA